MAQEKNSEFEVNEKLIIKAIGGLLILWFLLSSIKFIGAGDAAVVFNRFRGMSNMTLREGINFVNPLTVKTRTYSLKLQKSDFAKVVGMSSDNQTIGLSMAINWKYQPVHLKEIYQTIIGSVEDTVMHNVVYEVSKANLGKYKIGDIAVNREALRKDIENNLKDRMAQYFIDINNISIVDVQFSDDYEKAIEAKQVAQQKALEAEYNKQAAIREAEGQAQSYKLIQQTITPILVKQKWIEKWDGHLPQYMAGSDSGVILNMGSGANATTAQ